MRSKKQILASLDSFTRSYLETAIWSSTDESDDRGGEPIDKNYTIEDFTIPSLLASIADCEAFQAQNETTLASVYWTSENGSRLRNTDDAGHDFWLTRCGHGCGFWDGDYTEPHASVLTDASKAFGNVDLYVYRGRIYAAGAEAPKRARRVA